MGGLGVESSGVEVESYKSYGLWAWGLGFSAAWLKGSRTAVSVSSAWVLYSLPKSSGRLQAFQTLNLQP